MTRSGIRSRYRDTGPTSAVVGACLERACYACEICTAMLGDRRGEDWHLHHRRPRRMGGDRRPDTNTPANLLVLCPACHGTAESRRAEAYAVGWLLRHNDNPSYVAVLVQRDRWVYLTASGEYSDDPPDRAA